MRVKFGKLKKMIGLVMVLAMTICMIAACAVQASASVNGAPAAPQVAASGAMEIVLIALIVLLILVIIAAVVVVVIIMNRKKKSEQLSSPGSMPSPAPTNAQSFNRVQPMEQPSYTSGAPTVPQAPPVQNTPEFRTSIPNSAQSGVSGNLSNNIPNNIPAGIPNSRPDSFPVQAPGAAPFGNEPFSVEGAGDTTVLGAGAGPGGFVLLRKNGNEKVIINKNEFFIGKEKAKVDYCITNNNSVSRKHAKIKVRAGKCYISDLGSTNSTYINGTKLSPNQEVALIPGDKIKLSNEEFEYVG